MKPSIDVEDAEIQTKPTTEIWHVKQKETTAYQTQEKKFTAGASVHGKAIAASVSSFTGAIARPGRILPCQKLLSLLAANTHSMESGTSS
ncbi:hypothetical protein GUJ93_ZPchr0009g633 [Zizania palustris]|uniref:Uncharacterized protein n=1 Tax=Zizania palustris TaxID=103762 RepID=A0A8J5VIF0_ZIZPA|nr:hypothetical protein GUJ93_ZPchr0009g633 [Zizania palustris]